MDCQFLRSPYTYCRFLPLIMICSTFDKLLAIRVYVDVVYSKQRLYIHSFILSCRNYRYTHTHKHYYIYIYIYNQLYNSMYGSYVYLVVTNLLFQTQSEADDEEGSCTLIASPRSPTSIIHHSLT